MYNHMEHLLKCFNKTTGWNEDNTYSNILATSNSLLDFQIPKGGKLEISSHASPYSASSMSLSNYQNVSGSLCYIYSSIRLKKANGTKDISLQDAIAGFRIIEPYALSPKSPSAMENYKRASLLYGRMYFPGSALEALIIKRLSSRYQLLIKCISNPRLQKSGTMIAYLQENTPRFSREYIYSTNEALMGFRCLYNFGTSPKHQSVTSPPKFDNSVVSVGAEVWYAAISMSPGLSTSIRYSTRSTSTGKPLTMTLSCNPILGHVSSTYNVKTSVSSTVCSKYDFNWFSYASNLSLGFELYNFMKKPSSPNSIKGYTSSSIHHDDLAPLSSGESDHAQAHIMTRGRSVNPIVPIGNQFVASLSIPSNAPSKIAGEEVISEFQKLVKGSNFASVIKSSVSISDRMIKLLWVGRYKDFLVSTGMKMSLQHKTQAPKLEKFGVAFAYSC